VKHLFLLLLTLSFATTLRAQDEEQVSGRAHVFEFLNVATNPRQAALGGSFVAMKNDPNTIFGNPAALSTIIPDSAGRDSRLSFGFTKHILDINEGSLVYAAPTPESIGIGGTYSAGVQYIDYGSFTERNNKGESLGEFGAREVALTIAYSNIFPSRIRYGIGAKFISSSLVSGSSVQNYSSSGAAFDAGLFYEFDSLLMTAGIVAQNIGTQFSTYAGVDEALPFNLQLGVSKKLEKLPLTLFLTFRNLTRDREGRGLFFALNDFALGGEFVMGKVVRLRLGYENQKRRDLKLPSGSGLSGFSFGVGLNFNRYQIDYALSSLGAAFQPLHRMGASMAF
jgi:hypothetical protein